ncbi:alpha/beta hydrolase [Phenylobacterium sp.]|uniref:alpha/beta fold hydrolase n=1 Tax=Phenylobacterium sp. TaxID=1871053 RepID=UPI0030F37DBC
MKKWLKRIGLGVVAVVALTVLAGAGFEGLSRAAAARSFPAPGRLVDVGGGRRLQLDCRGTGSPVVIFESGLDTLGSLSWARVHGKVAESTRACAYSRAGIMWSDHANGPFDVRREVNDLHKALAAAGEKPPFVMVGHSLGGPYVLTYTGLYGGDVAGLVFVDASHPDQVARLRNAIGRDLDQGAGLIRAADSLAWSGAVRLFAPKGTIAPDHAPPQTALVAAAWQPQSIRATVRESNGLNETLTVAGQYRRLGDRPLVVLTRTATAPPAALKAMKLSPDQGRRLDAEWRAMQDDEAAWSTRSRHQVVADASHYIQFDQPKVVIAAVGDVVGLVRIDALAHER